MVATRVFYKPINKVSNVIPLPEALLSRVSVHSKRLAVEFTEGMTVIPDEMPEEMSEISMT